MSASSPVERTASQPAPASAATLEQATAERDTKCEVCGNVYDKAITIVAGGSSHVFDCFECAIHALAPTCLHCGCRIVGHGMESAGEMYCCAHCAKQSGARDLKDRS